METVLGWNRHSVRKGLQERKIGIIGLDNYRARGRHKSESKLPNLEVRYSFASRCSSSSRPEKFQTTFGYARIDARAVREALILEKGYKEKELPTRIYH